MNKILSDLDFWILFSEMEPSKDMGLEIYSSLLEQLKKHFSYREDRIPYEYNEEQRVVVNKVIEFEFSCGKDYSLVLDYIIDFFCGNACSQNKLFLVDKRNQKRYLLGWWDLAQWHPLCIAPEEFALLVSYWQKNDPTWRGTIYPKLLLKNYIGFHSPEEVEKFEEEIAIEFKKLNIEHFEDWKQKIIRVPFMRNEKYKWLNNEKLGWVYESKSYNCYSLRNVCHAEGGDPFPFKQWSEMINNIELELAQRCTIETYEGDWEEEPYTFETMDIDLDQDITDSELPF